MQLQQFQQSTHNLFIFYLLYLNVRNVNGFRSLILEVCLQMNAPDTKRNLPLKVQTNACQIWCSVRHSCDSRDLNFTFVSESYDSLLKS